MPYKNAKQRIPRELDRRRKVSEEIADNMRTMYCGGASISSIAQEFDALTGGR